MRYDRLFGLFIVVIMVGSLAGIAVSNLGRDDEQGPTGAATGRQEIEVNGYIFYEDPLQQSFEAIVTDETGNALAVPFRADPRNVSEIVIEDEAVEMVINAQKLYLVFDPNTPDFEETKNNVQIALAQTSRLINRVNVNQIFPIAALTADIPNETYDDQIPIKDCNDIDNTTTILFFTVGQDDSVKIKDECIIVSGKTFEHNVLNMIFEPG